MLGISPYLRLFETRRDYRFPGDRLVSKRECSNTPVAPRLVLPQGFSFFGIAQSWFMYDRVDSNHSTYALGYTQKKKKKEKRRPTLLSTLYPTPILIPCFWWLQIFVEYLNE